MNNAVHKPAVSVIIPTYNRSVTLRWTLRSVLAQHWTDFEVWIIGDACTDDTEEVVRSFADRRLNWVNLPVNSGNQAVPNTEGARRATGRYIAHLGHDDLWLPFHLQHLIATIEHTGADFVHAMVALYGPGGLQGVVGAPSNGRTYRNARMHPSGWLYRREVAEEIGAWNLPGNVRQPVDSDYVRRVYEAGKRIELAREVSVLKYPSVSWGAYGRNSDWPQQEPCELMERDPDALTRRVAQDIACRLAMDWRVIPRWRDVLRLGYEWGREFLLKPKPGYLPPIDKWTYQYLRRRALKVRGLRK